MYFDQQKWWSKRMKNIRKSWKSTFFIMRTRGSCKAHEEKWGKKFAILSKNCVTDGQTNRQTYYLTPYKGVCGFFLSVKFATPLLASLARDKVYHIETNYLTKLCSILTKCKLPYTFIETGPNQSCFDLLINNKRSILDSIHLGIYLNWLGIRTLSLVVW